MTSPTREIAQPGTKGRNAGRSETLTLPKGTEGIDE